MNWDSQFIVKSELIVLGVIKVQYLVLIDFPLIQIQTPKYHEIDRALSSLWQRRGGLHLELGEHGPPELVQLSLHGPVVEMN